jgi:hypothetical protein
MNRTPGQPKKDDPRKNQLRILLNDKEKSLFEKHGLTNSTKLRTWLLKQIEHQQIKLDD